MNVCFEHFAQSIINHSVPLHPIDAIKRPGNDRYVEMPFTFPGTGVSGVQLTLVLDQKFRWLKSPLELPSNSRCPVRAHGRTRLNGLTT